MSAEAGPRPPADSQGAARRGPSLRAVFLRITAGTAVAFLAVFGLGGLAITAALSRVEEKDVAERVARARLLLAREADTRLSTVREYAWWTDTWTYIDEPNGKGWPRWLRDNFIDWLPLRYGDEVIGIWRLDRRAVVRWTAPASIGLEREFERPERFTFVDSAKAVGGLLATRRGLYLAGYSVVVRTDDQQAAGPWHGYVAIARPVNAALVASWADALQERLVLRPLAGAPPLPPDSAVSVHTAGGDSVETRFVVNDLFGAPVAEVVLTGSRTFVVGLRWWILTMLGAAALVGLAILSAIWVVGHRQLVRPLESIAAALSGMRAGGGLVPLAAPAAAREWAVFTAAFNETVEARNASEERHRALFQHSADALFVLEGPAQRIVDANPAAERLTGCGRDTLVGRRLADLLEPLPDQADPPHTFRLRCEGQPEAIVEVVTGVIATGAREMVLASVRDRTEHHALEAQLRQAQKMEVLGRLAGGIAHDFNNLLGAVLVSASSLKDEVAADHPGQASIQSIERAARRAAELTRQLLSFARHEGVRREPVAVDEVVSGVRALCLRTFGKSVRLASELESPGLTVLGDAGQLEQALLNLCLNGRDAMPDGGTLTIRAGVLRLAEGGATAQATGLPAGAYVVVSVCDTGAGIPPEVVPRLFEPFFTTKERGKGTGLGLATTYGIVRSHGGAITAVNQPGAGARFDIFLPRAAGTAVRAVKTAPGALPRGSETVLLVDDEEELRRTVARSLSHLGYSVVQAANGREAVERFTAGPDDFHLVLLDLLMPEMSGVEALRAIRALRPDARVLVFTGYAMEEDIRRLLEGGAEGVLPKPFEIAELAQALRRILDRPLATRT